MITGPTGYGLHVTQSCNLYVMYCRLNIILNFNQIFACNQIFAYNKIVVFIQTTMKFYTYLFHLTLQSYQDFCSIMLKLTCNLLSVGVRAVGSYKDKKCIYNY